MQAEAELPDEVPIKIAKLDTLLAAPADTAEPAKPALATARSIKAG